MAIDDVYGHWLSRWNLTCDGAPVRTRTSRLLPVRRGDVRAMLKVAGVEEEHRGAALMDWYGGIGAACVLAREDNALLLERLSDSPSLSYMARSGHDDEATRIICGTVGLLHGVRDRPPPSALVPLSLWFRELGTMAAREGAILRKSLAAADDLLGKPRDMAVLHGDIHHANILHGGERGWLAIDPKGLFGERGFDYANIFCNPDAEVALQPGRLSRRLQTVAECTNLERSRLLNWVLAYAGLSASWIIQEGGDPTTALAIAELAAGS